VILKKAQNTPIPATARIIFPSVEKCFGNIIEKLRTLLYTRLNVYLNFQLKILHAQREAADFMIFKARQPHAYTASTPPTRVSGERPTCKPRLRELFK
jgi:hypothetical protein